MTCLEDWLEVILDEKEEESLRDTSLFLRLKYNLSCKIMGHSQSLLETQCIAVFHKANIKEKDACHLVYRDSNSHYVLPGISR